MTNPPPALRRLPLEGVRNARDLGGYPCASGMTRWGVFLRSDSLHDATPTDIETLRAFGVCTTVDLRSAHELAAYPSRLACAQGVCSHNVPLSDKLDDGDYEGDCPGTMAGLYMSLLDTAGDKLVQVIQLLAQAKNAAVFHCMVGKDRTGVIAMLLLQSMGVSDADIIADYCLTDTYIWDLLHTLHGGDDPPKKRGEVEYFGVYSKPRSMERALEHLHSRYSGAEAYLLQTGLPARDMESLKNKFLQVL